MKKKIFIALLGTLFILYLVAGFWMVPTIATKKAGPILSRQLGTQVTTGKIAFNPLTFELTVPDIRIRDKEGKDFFKMGALYVNASPISSLFKGSIEVKELRLKHPFLHVAIDRNGTFNFDNILHSLAQNPEGREAKRQNRGTASGSGIPKIRIRQFAIESADVTFDDFSTPEPTHIEAVNYNFGIENISTVPGEYGFAAYEIETRKTAFVRSFAKISLYPLFIRGYVDIRRVNFPHLDTYLKEFTRLEATEGTGNLFFNFEVAEKAGKLYATLYDGRIGIHALKIKDPIATPIRIGTFLLENIRAEWPRNRIEIDALALRESNIYVAQDRHGGFSFEKWVKKRPGTTHKAKREEDRHNTLSKPWQIRLNRIDVSGLHTRFDTPLYTLDADHTHHLRSLRIDTNGSATLSIPELQLSNIAILDKKERMKPLRISSATLRNGDVDLKKEQIEIERFTLSKPNLQVIRDKKGEINFQKLFVPRKKRVETPISRSKKEHPSPWVMTLKHFDLENGLFALDDRALANRNRLQVNKFDLRISTMRYPQKKPSPFKLSLMTPGKGNIGAKGTFLIDPLKANLTLNASGVALSPYVPYIREVVNLDIPSGSLKTRAKVVYNERKKPKVTIDYNIEVDDLQVDHALKKEKIFSVERILVKPATLQLMPNAMKIENVSLTKPYVKVHIAKDHTTNLDGIVVKKESSQAPERSDEEKEASKGLDFFLTQLTVENGESDFSDLSLPLPFETHIHDLEGEALGIGSGMDDVTSVGLKGIVDKYGMAKIKALLIAADPIKKSEIHMDFRNLDVTNLSPYTGKYIGYAIKDGRLWLNLKYEIDEGRLRSDNKIVLKKLELGEKIESNESIDAPIQLALALLKDSRGVIDLDIPVEGNVTDPKFKIGKVVWQAIGNMISGIVTAPFRFLGKMLGIKGEELEYVVFEPGLDIVEPTEMEKLDKIVRIFEKRPLLKLKLTGRYSPEADTRGLRVLKLRQILVAKAKITKTEELKQVMTQELLEGLYKERAGSKALYALKKAYFKEAKEKKKKPDKREYLKRIYEALLLTVPVETSELKGLGDARARQITEYLVAKKIPRSRVAMVPAKAAEKLTETGMVPLKLELSAVK